ncbi:hypothetical protein Tco_0573478 [Tanacetum coccineum]
MRGRGGKIQKQKRNTIEEEGSSSQVERELAISKESVSETVRWISYGPRATVVKYDAYNINGYTFRTKCHDGKVYQNSGVSVEAIDLHISKEVATTRQAFYYGVLQEIWVLDYRFRQIPLFKCDWVNHRAGGVKRDNLGYTLVDLNNLGHKVDLFILASQARQVFYVKDQIDKKLSIVFKTPPKNYKDTYDEVDEEFSTVIHQRNDNILPCVNRRDLGNESRDDYYQTDCGGVVIRIIMLALKAAPLKHFMSTSAFKKEYRVLAEWTIQHTGYSQNSEAYIILHKHTRKVEESLNVTFDETPPPSKTSPLMDDDLDEEEAIKVTEKKNLENDIEDETLEIDEIVNIKESSNHPLENIIGNLNQRTFRSQAKNQSNFFCFISTIEPKNVNEALTDDSWIVAMQEELNQFIDNDL